MTDVEQKAARPHNELIRELLDSRIPKSEREHAAAREIERLREEVDRLNRILGRIVAWDGDSTLKIFFGADAFDAAREYLLSGREEGGAG